MKNIDIKSVIIGGLLATTVFFGLGAASKVDKGKWDDKQEWLMTSFEHAERTGLVEGSTYRGTKSPRYIGRQYQSEAGWEPYAGGYRKRIK